MNYPCSLFFHIHKEAGEQTQLWRGAICTVMSQGLNVYICACLLRLEVTALPQSTEGGTIFFTPLLLTKKLFLYNFEIPHENVQKPKGAHTLTHTVSRRGKSFWDGSTWNSRLAINSLKKRDKKQQTFPRYFCSWLGDAFIWKPVNLEVSWTSTWIETLNKHCLRGSDAGEKLQLTHGWMQFLLHSTYACNWIIKYKAILYSLVPVSPVTTCVCHLPTDCTTNNGALNP